LLPILDPIETRVLGALLEKSISTPEYYPLSLNALINACNQKSNRDPVMALDEETVRNAGGSLGTKGMVAFLRDARATKYEHRLAEVLNLGRREEAILCELLLRGPQTPGELRGRTERLHPMEEIADVQSTLQRMMEREPALVTVLPRQPGTKEVRYAHLLSGEPVVAETPRVSFETPRQSGDEELKDRVTTLEQQVIDLNAQVEMLNGKIEDLLRQLG
jgi:uncharacterized protein YceH (UPF0502 family)